jgi:hypothetical protein
VPTTRASHVRFALRPRLCFSPAAVAEPLPGARRRDFRCAYCGTSETSAKGRWCRTAAQGESPQPSDSTSQCLAALAAGRHATRRSFTAGTCKCRWWRRGGRGERVGAASVPQPSRAAWHQPARTTRTDHDLQVLRIARGRVMRSTAGQRGGGWPEALLDLAVQSAAGLRVAGARLAGCFEPR